MTIWEQGPVLTGGSGEQGVLFMIQSSVSMVANILCSNKVYGDSFLLR